MILTALQKEVLEIIKTNKGTISAYRIALKVKRSNKQILALLDSLQAKGYIKIPLIKGAKDTKNIKVLK